jgi:hypothetical protein
MGQRIMAGNSVLCLYPGGRNQNQRLKIKGKIKSKVKGGGQECPPHILLVLG